MPTRSRSHVLEEDSIRRLRDALPPGWVYREKSPDYGVDGEVEIFNDDGSSTGLSFNIQLRATDDPARADRVRVEVDELGYYASLDLPTAVVRYGSAAKTLFWQWASNILSRANIADDQVTVTYRFGDDEKWDAATSGTIRRTLEVRRRLSNFPPHVPVPLRIDLSSIPAAERYAIDRAIAGVIAESRGALVRAGAKQAAVEAFVRLEPNYMAIGIDSLTGVTFDFRDTETEDYISAILYGFTRIFRRQGLVRHAESLALVLLERQLTCHNADLAFDACMSLTRDLSALVRLAILNRFHEDGPTHAMIAIAIAKAPADDQTRRLAMDAFFRASLASAREQSPISEAAEHYSIGNFYRNQREVVQAVHHYNRARHLRPAYLRASYFYRELAGVLFQGRRYSLAQRFYREAARLEPEFPNIDFLLADALLLSGAVAEARDHFSASLERSNIPHMLVEAELKIMLCHALVETHASSTVPSRRSEANLVMKGEAWQDADRLEFILQEVDALNPLANFNLGIMRSQHSDYSAAVHHFVACAIVQPHDVIAWSNAAISALRTGDEALLLCVLSTAIHHMGADAYDEFRGNIAAQGASRESLELLDEMAMGFLEETETPSDEGFTLRVLSGDSYETMTILGHGNG